MIFVLNYLVLAWTEPAQSPPEGNVSAPLNVGNTGQSKAGGLILNTGGAVTGLVVDKGNVGIGMSNPSNRLEVSGKIYSSDDILSAGNINATKDIKATRNIIASEDVCSEKQGVCLKDLADHLSTTMLVNAAHTWGDCKVAAGKVVDSDVGLKQCQFNLASCPGGWTQYKSFTTTNTNSCGSPTQTRCTCGWSTPCCNAGCIVSGNSWGNYGVPRCWYSTGCSQCCSDRSGNCQPACCGYGSWCYTSVSQIGCY